MGYDAGDVVRVGSEWFDMRAMVVLKKKTSKEVFYVQTVRESGCKSNPPGYLLSYTNNKLQALQLSDPETVMGVFRYLDFVLAKEYDLSLDWSYSVQDFIELKSLGLLA